ncbi:MAG: GAF domain-containing protein [Bacillota bacterium]
MSATEARERIAHYLRAAGLVSLLHREADVERAARDLLEAMGEKVAVMDADSLYSYSIPMLSEDGSCSLPDQLSPVPYDLGPILGGRSEQTTRRLALLERLVERAQETTGAEWLGIYQRRVKADGAAVLVKLAYMGRPSRAEFPLSREFAGHSTNSSVGLTGHAIVIDDVRRHVEGGGGFYVCDSAVEAEACLTILDERLNVVGIVDAEAHRRSFFDAERLAVLAALCVVAPPVLP